MVYYFLDELQLANIKFKLPSKIFVATWTTHERCQLR